MINKQCTIAKITTMADGGVRLVVDLLNAGANEMAEAYRLKMTDTTIILSATNQLPTTIQQVGEQLIHGETQEDLP